MRLLITGGSGLLGSKLTSIAVNREYETYSGYYKNKVYAGIPVPFDICNKKAVRSVFDRIRPDVVVHTAALTDVDRCEEEKELARNLNIDGTKNIVDSSIDYAVFLVYISTDYVFSGKRGMYNETDSPEPINYYGLTKLEGEKLVTRLATDWCIVRPSVIFGTKPAVIEREKVNFALWVLQNLRDGEPIRIVTDQWVSPTLNTNLSQMILEIIERRHTGIYHLAGATALSRHDFANLIYKTFQLNKSLVYPIKSREMKWIAKRPKNTSLNVEKAAKILQNKPLPIQTALNKFKDEIEVMEGRK